MDSSQHKYIEAPPCPTQRSSHRLTIDWTLCALCQEVGREGLISPGTKNGDGYKYVAENLMEFQELGLSPLPIPLINLDDGKGFEETFRRNSASWHKVCRSKVSNTILARKRKQNDNLHTSPIKTRRAASTSAVSSENNRAGEVKTSISVDQQAPTCLFFLRLLIGIKWTSRGIDLGLRWPCPGSFTAS